MIDPDELRRLGYVSAPGITRELIRPARLRWFLYWMVTGKGHPDHIAFALQEMK